MDPKLQAVVDEYEKTLVLPAQKPAVQCILAPVGLVGAGKTTVLKPLAERLNLLRISGDEIRLTLRKHGLPFGHVAEVRDTLAEKYVSEGYSIASDSDSVSPRAQKLLEAYAQRGIKVIWIHINPPEEFILNKLHNLKTLPHYSKDGLFQDPEAGVANYFRRKNLHENLTMPFIYTFDTSRNDVQKQIDEAEALIRSALNE